MTKICPECGKEFHVYPSECDRRIFCSKACYGKEVARRDIGNTYSTGRKAPWLSELNRRPGRNAEISRRTAQKRADKVRYTGSRNNYVKRNNKHEHRLIMERILGRKLGPDEIVHHKDGDKWNNSPENLVILTRQEHIELHRKQMCLAKAGDAR